MTRSTRSKSTTPAEPGLSEAFDRAIQLAHDFHRADVRKGTDIPYFAHLLQVAGLVLEAGGTEDQAIAALLHDALEDSDTQSEAEERERRIRRELGDRVAALVLGCTDGWPDEKERMNWRARKERYLLHLRNDAEPDVLIISIADKLHNARASLRDYNQHAERLWKRFRGGKSGTLWYYRRLVEAYRHRGVATYLDELDDVVSTLELRSVRGSRKHVLN